MSLTPDKMNRLKALVPKIDEARKSAGAVLSALSFLNASENKDAEQKMDSVNLVSLEAEMSRVASFLSLLASTLKNNGG